MKAIQSFLGNL